MGGTGIMIKYVNCDPFFIKLDGDDLIRSRNWLYENKTMTKNWYISTEKEDWYINLERVEYIRFIYEQ